MRINISNGPIKVNPLLTPFTEVVTSFRNFLCFFNIRQYIMCKISVPPIQKMCFFPTECIYVFCMSATINTIYIRTQNWRIDIYNGEDTPFSVRKRVKFYINCRLILVFKVINDNFVWVVRIKMYSPLLRWCASKWNLIFFIKN